MNSKQICDAIDMSEPTSVYRFVSDKNISEAVEIALKSTLGEHMLPYILCSIPNHTGTKIEVCLNSEQAHSVLDILLQYPDANIIISDSNYMHTHRSGVIPANKLHAAVSEMRKSHNHSRNNSASKRGGKRMNKRRRVMIKRTARVLDFCKAV
jgi:hypothetical protein